MGKCHPQLNGPLPLGSHLGPKDGQKKQQLVRVQHFASANDLRIAATLQQYPTITPWSTCTTWVLGATCHQGPRQLGKWDAFSVPSHSPGDKDVEEHRHNVHTPESMAQLAWYNGGSRWFPNFHGLTFGLYIVYVYIYIYIYICVCVVYIKFISN